MLQASELSHKIPRFASGGSIDAFEPLFVRETEYWPVTMTTINNINCKVIIFPITPPW